jgi:ABC-type Fe3+ transport system substrate-binding protein
VFAAGVTTTAKAPTAAKALIQFLVRSGAAAIAKSGMEPVALVP